MNHDTSPLVSPCIREAAEHAAAAEGLAALPIERFLRTREETWEGAGSGRFTLTQFAIRKLFDLLANLLPADVQSGQVVSPDIIRQRIEPMVTGLVQTDWREVALHEMVARTFILNVPGARGAINAELKTCTMGTAWRILWALFGDHALTPGDFDVGCDGIAADYAHVRWSAYQTRDPYSDVVVHETAHLLHYLRPSYYRRIAFAEKMREAAFPFPRTEIETIATLVLRATRARNGWRVIRQAAVIPKVHRHLANAV